MMINYHVQRGDTIAEVTKQMGVSWQELKRENPEAVGRSNLNGNWFLREGATLSFADSLQSSLAHINHQQATQVPPPQSNPEIFFPNQAAAANQVTINTNSTGRAIEHIVQPGDTIWEMAVRKYAVHIRDIIADNNIADPRLLQIGQKLIINLPGPQPPQKVVASWYGEPFHGRPMANSDIYDMYAPTIAHKELPLGTRVELENPANGVIVQATITDRGPFIAGRDVDLSYGLARQLDTVERGVVSLIMRIL